MKSRFGNRDDLIDALLGQRIILGNTEIAAAFADAGEVVEYAAGKTLITQGDSDRDLYFLLVGSVQVIINGLRILVREAGVTVGEMSALHPGIARSATLEANETTVALKVGHTALQEIADQHPAVWKRLAKDLAGRLEQRNKFVQRSNTLPHVFMICSKEALDIAEEIRLGLSHEKFFVELWSDDKIFPAGAYPIEALEAKVTESDFGIAIAEPDDIVRSRERQQKAPRDNVIFELGFFMSRLGRNRTILLVPKGEDIKLPSDFKGITPLTYTGEPKDPNLSTLLGPTIHQIKKIIRERGIRSSLIEAK
ncbi:TIR domain-containing protein [Cupriavidus pinatubonensis]|uniref:Cyclic nucleotide-binding domain-containing protein n=1 Tax=Cupriavidus pinatubonensis TaxID=248026 RepID=A0ABN7Z5Z0_9BURK|nr:TIR domain-containing protein [Cupriavidus pinatubonensis]CAG9180618.1 hypothetical protein LMG23994_04460 [Cupriavidus pinatubonensis]